MYLEEEALCTWNEKGKSEAYLCVKKNKIDV